MPLYANSDGGSVCELVQERLIFPLMLRASVRSCVRDLARNLSAVPDGGVCNPGSPGG
jgi:hypothetical protein